MQGTYDVIIAGAGPVGLFLASELRRAHLSVLILEQLSDPRSPLKGLPFGMRGLWGPSIEAFYRRGLLDKIAALPSTAPGGNKPGKKPAGHFAGIQFDRSNIDTARWSYRLPGPTDQQLGTSMEHLETVLSEYALSLGVEIRRGQGVESFEATRDGVIVNGSLDAKWLVGCDGGRSTVRKLGGFSFVGTEPEFTGYSIHVELDDPTKIPLGRHATPTGNYTQAQPGYFGLCDFDGGAMHRKPVTAEHAQALLRKITGTDVTVKALHLASTWTDRSMQATTYRNGRVLLAGDAAHVHSPLGGQGLNLGLADAMNLGWKLAATIHGTAPDGLLETYTSERHPSGARVLDWTRAQVTVMRPSSRALEAVIRDLVETRDGATYFAERVWGVTMQYDLGETHPLAGRSCPNFELVDGARTGTLLGVGHGLLLDFDRTLAPIAGVKHITSDVKDRLGLSAVLVRPDGFVAWASDSTPSQDAVERAASRWFTIAR